MTRAKESIPGKPIRHIVLSHFHDDHTGGVRTYAAEEAAVVVHSSAGDYIRAVLDQRRKVVPDRLEMMGLVHTHFASANCVSKTRRGKSGKFGSLFGARLGAGNEFALAHTVEGTPISNFTRGFDSAYDGPKSVELRDYLLVPLTICQSPQGPALLRSLHSYLELTTG